MRNIKLILIFLIFSQTSVFSNELDQQQQIREKIDTWYSATGLTGKVSKGEFEAAVRGFFYYNKKRKVSQKNILGIIDFKTPSSEKRFFIFQIGDSAQMLREEWVSHGVNSGGLTAESFSNVNESHMSSRGFYKTGETYTGKYGFSLRLDGLEQGVNDKVRPRAIVLHSGKYIGYGQTGRSWGCFTVAADRSRAVINLVKGGVLIYASDGSSHGQYSFMSGDSVKVADIESLPNTNHDPGPEVDPNYKKFSDVSEFKDSGETVASKTGQTYPQGGLDFGTLGTSMAVPAIAAMASIQSDDSEESENPFSTEMSVSSGNAGKAPLGGSEGFENCQLRASAPWDEVVNEAQSSSGNPEKYFKATYNKLDQDSREMDNVPDEVLKNGAIDNYAENQKCIALARMMKDSDFSQDGANSPGSYASKDGSIECEKTGVESQDYSKCIEIAQTQNALLDAEEKLKSDQRSGFKASNTTNVATLGTSKNQQTDALKLQSDSQLKQADMVGERADFQQNKLIALNKLQTELPSRNSILNDCQQYVGSKDFGKKHLKAYLDYLDVQDRTIPSTPDPCLSVSKTMGVNLVQNIKAKKQAIRLVEKAGMKVLDLSDKQRSLLDNNNTSSRLTLNTKLRGHGEGFKAEKAEVLSGSFSDRSGNQNEMLNGHNKNITLSRSSGLNTKFGQGRSSDNGRSQEISAKNVDLSGKFGGNSVGSYSPLFYKQVNNALKGKHPIAMLSVNQKYEYNLILKREEEFRKRKKALTNKSFKGSKSEDSKFIGLSIEEQKTTNKLSREIWFDEKLTIFGIISNRYKSKFKKQ